MPFIASDFLNQERIKMTKKNTINQRIQPFSVYSLSGLDKIAHSNRPRGIIAGAFAEMPVVQYITITQFSIEQLPHPDFIRFQNANDTMYTGWGEGRYFYNKYNHPLINGRGGRWAQPTFITIQVSPNFMRLFTDDTIVKFRYFKEQLQRYSIIRDINNLDGITQLNLLDSIAPDFSKISATRIMTLRFQNGQLGQRRGQHVPAQLDYLPIEDIDHADDSQVEFLNNKFIKNTIDDKGRFIRFYSNEYLLSNFIPMACLYTSVINHFYNDLKTRYGIELTYPFLRNIVKPIGRNLVAKDENDWSASIKSFMPFFRDYKYGIKIMNIKEQIIYEKSYCTHKFSDLVVISHNGHLFPITETISFGKLKQILREDRYLYDAAEQLCDYNIKTPSVDYEEFTSIKEIFKIMNKSKKDSVIKFLCFNSKYVDEYSTNTRNYAWDLVPHLIELRDKYKYIPKLLFTNRCLTHIVIKCKNKKDEDVSAIIFNDITSHQAQAEVPDILSEYKQRDEWYNKLYNKLITADNTSTYTDTFYKWMNDYKPNILSGKFKEFNHNTYTDIWMNEHRPNTLTSPYTKNAYFDFSKAYTSCLIDIKRIPVFSSFCKPYLWNNGEIEDYTWYLIEIKDKHIKAFNESLTTIYGYNLKKLPITSYKIIEYIEPTYTQRNETIELIEQLYSNECVLSDDREKNESNKKFVTNKLIGSLGSTGKRFETGIYCSNEEQAKRLYEDYGYSYEIKDSNDNNVGSYYINEEYKRFKSGFLPIHHMILDNMRMKIYELINKLELLKCDVLAVRTDAVYFKYDNFEILKPILNENSLGNNLYKNIGKLKYSEFNESNGIYKMSFIRKIEKTYVKYGIDKLPIIYNRFDDERNKDLSKCINHILLIAKYAGCGKTFTCEEIIKKYTNGDNSKAIFVIDNHALCNDIINRNKINKYKATTLCGFMGCGIDGSKLGHSRNDIDITKFEVVVFEELFACSLWKLEKIKQFMIDNPNVKYIANGDPLQLSIPGKCPSEKINEYIFDMFPNVWQLQQIQRMDNPQKLYEIREYIDTHQNIPESEQIKFIVDNWFGKQLTSQINKPKGYCLFNETRLIINNSINHDINKRLKNIECSYRVGQTLVVKKGYRDGGNTFYPNNEYKIKKITQSDITIQPTFIDYDFPITISLPDINNYFSFNYIKTIFSAQGMSVDEHYIIYNIYSTKMSIKAFWVAITRARQFEYIHIYKGALFKKSINQMIKNTDIDDDEIEYFDDNEYISDRLIEDNDKKSNEIEEYF